MHIHNLSQKKKAMQSNRQLLVSSHDFQEVNKKLKEKWDRNVKLAQVKKKKIKGD